MRQKICPQCSTLAPLEAQACLKCGHLFRTHFAPDPTTQPQPPQPMDPTQYMLPPQPGPYQPPAAPSSPNWQGTHQQPPGPYSQPQFHQQYPPYQIDPNQQPPYGQGFQQNYYYRQPSFFGQTGHSPLTAVLLSVLCLPGAGQWYNRQLPKGVLLFVVGVALTCVTLGQLGAGGVLAAIVAAVDAGMVAKRIKSGQPVGPWQWF